MCKYVHKYVWMDYGFRFMDPNGEICWTKLVDKAIEDKLTVSVAVSSVIGIPPSREHSVLLTYRLKWS